MTQEQLLRQQGWTEENIEKLRVISNNPDAQQYALKTGDLKTAYEMASPKEKLEVHNLNEWFSSWAKESPEDSKSLSVALTKFSRFVQSETDKNQKKDI